MDCTISLFIAESVVCSNRSCEPDVYILLFAFLLIESIDLILCEYVFKNVLSLLFFINKSV